MVATKNAEITARDESWIDAYGNYTVFVHSDRCQIMCNENVRKI